MHAALMYLIQWGWRVEVYKNSSDAMEIVAYKGSLSISEVVTTSIDMGRAWFNVAAQCYAEDMSE